MDAPNLARRLAAKGFETEVHHGSEVLVIHGHQPEVDGLHRLRSEVRSIDPGAREIGHAVSHARMSGCETVSLLRVDCAGGPREGTSL